MTREEKKRRIIVQLVAAEQRIKELEGLLREYGRHTRGCNGDFFQHKCECGWDDISAALQPEKPQEREREQWVCAACGRAHTGICDVMHGLITGEPQEGKEC